MAVKTLAVVLSGCGFLDGTEIHEAVAALLAIDSAGATYGVFAPDKKQSDVVDHVRKKPEKGESRNVMTEAARIARGDIKPVAALDMKDFDALVLPGGFGAAKNLIDYAAQGAGCQIDPDVDRVVKQAHNLGKPIGAICIAPMVVARSLGADHHPTLTIGTDPAAAADIERLGGKHTNTMPTAIAVDEKNRIVSTPAYMTATRVSEVWQGVSALVNKVIALVG